MSGTSVKMQKYPSRCKFDEVALRGRSYRDTCLCSILFKLSTGIKPRSYTPYALVGLKPSHCSNCGNNGYKKNEARIS